MGELAPEPLVVARHTVHAATLAPVWKVKTKHGVDPRVPGRAHSPLRLPGGVGALRVARAAAAGGRLEGLEGLEPLALHGARRRGRHLALSPGPVRRALHLRPEQLALQHTDRHTSVGNTANWTILLDGVPVPILDT